MNAPLVKNAADRNQVKLAGRKERDKAARDMADVRAVLATPEGKRFVWRLLGHSQMFESIWHPSALIHANAGRQDFGHFIWNICEQADQEAVFAMMREAKVAEKRDALEAQAVQQSSNGDTE